MNEPTYKVMVWRPNRKRRHTLYTGLTLEKAKDAAIEHCIVARARRIRARFDIEQERK